MRSKDREGVHPQSHLSRFHGVLQADAYGGYKALYADDRRTAFRKSVRGFPSECGPDSKVLINSHELQFAGIHQGGAITEAACWAHGRRKFYALADIAAKARDPRIVISPIALEAVQRIDAIFVIERMLNGLNTNDRRAARQVRVRPLVDDLHMWMKDQRGRVSGKTPLGKALHYMLVRWDAFARFLNDGVICLTNNAAERALRDIAIGRKSWLFAGSERGGARAAMIYSLIMTAKLNGVDPHAWLADVLARIADHPAARLAELLPWHWTTIAAATERAA